MGGLRDRSWKLIKGRHRCQASRESPGDSILPGSTVRASAAAMASLDVAVANCEGVILPERSASNWSASCGHMHTLYLQKTHISCIFPVQDWYFKAAVKVTSNSRSCSLEKLQDGDFNQFYMVSISA